MTRPLDPALIAVATQVQTRIIRAFQFYCDQIPAVTWNYTDSPQQIIIAGAVFLPAAISLKGSKEGGDGTAKNKDFKIEAGRLEPFVSLVGRSMPFVWNVSVWDVYVADDGTLYEDFVADGQLTECSRDAVSIDLTFGPLSAWLQKSIPAMLFSPTDPRMPYGADFGVDPDAFAVAATVQAVSQNVVYSSAASAQARDYFAGGILSYQRTIAGQTVTLPWLIMNSIPSGDPAHPELGYFILAGAPVLLDNLNNNSFNVYPGYDGSVGESVSLFNNFDAGSGYFGFPWLPPQNPVLTSQALAKAPATVDQSPTIDHYENNQGDTITTAAVSQQVAIVAPVDFAFFGSPASSNSLVVNGVTVAPVSWSSSRIVFNVPGTSTSPLSITLTTSKGLQASDDSLALGAAQFIDHVANAAGTTITSGAITQQIVIIGCGFGPSTPNCFVTIGAVKISASSKGFKWTDTDITSQLPIAPSYPYAETLSVTTDAGVTIDGGAFTITGTTASELISGFTNDNSPAIAVTSGPSGMVLHLVGAGFGNTKGSITMNGLDVVAGGGAIKSWNDTDIAIIVPTPASFPNTGAVVVTTAGGLVSTGPNFTIGVAAGFPWIDAVHANNTGRVAGIVTSGTVASKLYYYIIGENLGTGPGAHGSVSFGTTPPTFPPDLVEPKNTSAYYVQWGQRQVKIALWALPSPTAPVPIVVTRSDGQVATGPNFEVND